MALIARAVLGNDGQGNLGMRVSKSPYDVLSTDPSEFTKMAFDSSWDRVEKIHQAGTMTLVRTGADVCSASFPALPYRPIVSVRWKDAANKVFADYWWTITSGGTDAMRNLFMVHTEVDLVAVEVFPLAHETNGSSPFIGAGTYYFNYIVWKLPGE